MQNVVCYEEKRDSKAECEWKEKGVLNANTVRIQSSPVLHFTTLQGLRQLVLVVWFG